MKSKRTEFIRKLRYRVFRPGLWLFLLSKHKFYWKLRIILLRLSSLCRSHFSYDVAIIVLPPFNPSSPPIGATYIHSVLKLSGYKSRLIDFSVGLSHPFSPPRPEQSKSKYFQNIGAFKFWMQKLEATGAQFFGFSVWMCNESTSTEFASFLRSRHPEWTLLFGGPSCNRNNVKKLVYYADYCVFNEGEDVVVRLLDCLRKKLPIRDIPNVYYESKGYAAVTLITEGLSDLHGLPFPDFSDLNLNRYSDFGDGYRRIPVQFSRGCIGNCSFCEQKIYHKTQRSRTGLAVYHEVIHQQRSYKTRRFYFVDDSLVSKRTKDEVAVFCKLLIENQSSIDWIVYATRVDSILTDPDYVSLLSTAGLSSITLGVESFSTKVLKHMGKNSNQDLALKVISTLRQAGVKINIFLIYGYPVETAEDFEETITCLKKLSNDLTYVVYNVFGPTTKYIELARRKGTGIITPNPSYEPAWTSKDSDLRVRQSRFFHITEVLQAIKEKQPNSFYYLAGDAHNLIYLDDWNLAKKEQVIRSWKKCITK